MVTNRLMLAANALTAGVGGYVAGHSFGVDHFLFVVGASLAVLSLLVFVDVLQSPPEGTGQTSPSEGSDQ